jgi:tetratricopeptide (TPR) repeat protein
VGDDTLARLVSRLRKKLGDTHKPHHYIETIPKRGYLLRAEIVAPKAASIVVKRHSFRNRLTIGAALVTLIILVTVSTGFFSDEPVQNEWIDRADAFYMRFTRQYNEAAIALYERVLEADPDHITAQSGLANALVQRVVRWPEQFPAPDAPSIRYALNTGQLQTEAANVTLTRAQALAERALRQSPENTQAMKALALVYSAQGKLGDAFTLYEAAIETDQFAWRSLINLGEIHLIREQQEQAINRFEAAYQAMQSRYSREPHLIGPWQPSVGNLIAQLYEARGDTESAARWYQEVLSKAPMNNEARNAMARLQE